VEDRPANITWNRFVKGGALTELAPQNFAVELFLGTEAVEQHAFIDPSAARDVITSCSGEAMGREFGKRRVQDAVAGTAQIAASLHN
jgi:hypothetical protein